MLPQKIMLLVNPIAGTKKKDVVEKKFAKACVAKQIAFEILPTQPFGTYSFLEDKIVNEQFTDIVVAGGDGTINHVFSSLCHLPNIRFGILPVGSGNGLANSAHIPHKLEQAIGILFNPSTISIDGFSINHHTSFMLSGLGFDARVAQQFSQQNTRGLLTYTKQSLVQFFKAQPYTFSITIDGVQVYTDAFFISVANSNQFGNNVTIAPQASLTDGLLDVVIVQKMSKMKLPFALLQQIRGNNRLQALVQEFQEKHIIYLQTPELKIHNLKLAPLHVDGDPVETAEHIHIQVHRQLLSLIVPKT